MRRIKFIRGKKVHPVRHTSLTFTRVKLCKRAEVNSEPSHLWYDIFSIGGMQLPVSWVARASRVLTQKVLDFFLRPLSWDLYLQTILVTSGAIWSLKLKSKTKVSIVELLLSTLIESSRYQFLLALLCWRGNIMNNHK